MNNNILKQRKLIYLIGLFLMFSMVIEAQSNIVKVACTDNSITYGYGIKVQIRDAYPAVLGRMLEGGFEVQNFERSGATLLRNSNYSYWKTATFQNAKSFNPDIVVIKLGTNDSKSTNQSIWSEFQNDLSNMVDTFRLLPSHPKIYLCLPVPSYSII